MPGQPSIGSGFDKLSLRNEQFVKFGLNQILVKYSQSTFSIKTVQKGRLPNVQIWLKFNTGAKVPGNYILAAEHASIQSTWHLFLSMLLSFKPTDVRATP